MAPISAAELNTVIFRYLLESRFKHSAFFFKNESALAKSNIDAGIVQPSALVTLVQKGILYMENEVMDKLDDDEDLQLSPLDLVTKSTDELVKIIKEKKEKNKSTEGNINALDFLSNIVKRKRSQRVQVQSFGKRMEEEKDITIGVEAMDICGPEVSPGLKIPKSEVTALKGHRSEVFSCAWSPDGSLLASGSADATARIWTVDKKPSYRVQNAYPSVVLRHSSKETDKISEVIKVGWNTEGSLLATGSSDGHARIWNRDGGLISMLTKHEGTIFSLKWNKKGNFLLTGSFDETAIVWDVQRAQCKQQFKFHKGYSLDVDWQTNDIFATCSVDRMIYVCRVGTNRPIRTIFAHKARVNSVRWGPTRSLLASCSADHTAKIWTLKKDDCLAELRHTKEVHCIGWSPGPGGEWMLASASCDSTVKIWDIDAGRVVKNLTCPSDSIAAIAFSPNGEYLACGSVDQCVYVWSVKEGKIVKTYRAGSGAVYEVCWNARGDRIAAAYSGNEVCVADFRM